MAAYMRGRFAFLGISAVPRRHATKPILSPLRDQPCWELINDCWDQPHREYQYVACDHLRTQRHAVPQDQLPALYRLVTTHSWWDTVDPLAGVIGRMAPATDTMLSWAHDPNLWIRRVALLHQLGRRDATDTDLLSACIQANVGTGEFFLDKAIGWALRDYARTNPIWVRNFVHSCEGKGLSALSRREALKHIGTKG